MDDPAETRDPRPTFGTVVDVYDEIRPTYPDELFDAFFSLLGAQPEVLEVGPGTGQATRDLLARGAAGTGPIGAVVRPVRGPVAGLSGG